MRKVILLSILIVLIITLQAVQSKEIVTSGEIEIVSDKTNIFVRPPDIKKTDAKPVTLPSIIEITSPRKDPFQIPMVKPDKSSVTGTTDRTGENPFLKPVSYDRTDIADNRATGNRQEEIYEGNTGNLFKYKGVLWNGSQYLAIITFDKKSYIVRTGDRLVEGYNVLYVDEKEIIVEKKGQKNSIKLQ